MSSHAGLLITSRLLKHREHSAPSFAQANAYLSGQEHERMTDREANRFSARAARYARVGANVGGVAARLAGARMLGGERDRAGEASALSGALGRLKGPIMKVAQLMATIPDLLPAEYAVELQKLQSEAPPMGWAFVRRRMIAEL